MRARTAMTLVVLLGVLLACSAERPEPAAGIDLGQALGGNPDPSFARATAPRSFEFPRDHAAHPDYRNEWWYFTGHLRGVDGRRFGFQLTLFRIGLIAPAQRRPRQSDWAADHVYMGHFALSDIDAPQPPRFRAYERFARAGAGLAGAESTPLQIWLEDWRIARDTAGEWHLSAREDGTRLDLRLTPASAILLQGDRGLSQKSAQPGNASYYYSLPRLTARGWLGLDGQRIEVDGTAWLDREWSSSALGAEQTGWDWFSLQLDDGSILMYYQLRRRDGSADPHSAGVYLDPDGRRHDLRPDALQLEVVAHWDSPRGGRYPARWRIASALLARDLWLRPLLADQELDLRVRYWEGAVSVTDAADRRLGQGYVELTGYAD